MKYLIKFHFNKIFIFNTIKKFKKNFCLNTRKIKFFIQNEIKYFYNSKLEKEKKKTKLEEINLRKNFDNEKELIKDEFMKEIKTLKKVISDLEENNLELKKKNENELIKKNFEKDNLKKINENELNAIQELKDVKI